MLSLTAEIRRDFPTPLNLACLLACMYVCLSILTTAFVFLYSAVETPSNDTFAVGATVAYETETDVDPLGVSSLFVGEDQNGIATFHGGQKRNRAKGREEDKGEGRRQRDDDDEAIRCGKHKGFGAHSHSAACVLRLHVQGFIFICGSSPVKSSASRYPHLSPQPLTRTVFCFLISFTAFTLE